MVANMAIKYYAIVSGRTPGIYTDWPTAESMVKGFPGPIFKSFRTKTEAENFMRRSTAVPTITATKTTIPHTLPLIDKTIIYTDGSFADGSCGFGVVIIASNSDKITACGRVPLDPTNNVAELYAMYVGLSLVRGDVIIYSDSRYSIACLTSYIHDWLVNGWGGVANRNIIEPTYNLTLNRTVTFQYVPAHSGVELNEEADKLANQGRLSGEQLIIVKNGVKQALST